MKPYIIDAFTTVPLGGNAAGVVRLTDGYPPESEMLALAKELGFSETAFVLPLDKNTIQLRYFTPTDEVDLCGHATVAAFHGLLQWGAIESGQTYTGRTLAGDLNIDVATDGTVWLDMAPPQELGELTQEDSDALYKMYGLQPQDAGGLRPAMVSSGLPDIMMPIATRELLAVLQPDMGAITELSKKLNVTGVHAFVPGDGEICAYVRNFAPLYGIDEEAATGTANGALTYYLYRRGLVKPGEINRFLQGEAMGRPSEIRSRLEANADQILIRVGGHAVIRP